jgi:MFS family permease
MSPGMASTGQYFHKKRGAAMGVAMAGSSVGGVVFPLALSKMFYSPSLGFGWSVRICGFLMLAILGLSCSVIRARLPPRKGQLFILSTFTEFRFVSLVGAVFLILTGVFIPFFYLPSFAVSHGMSQILASDLVAILNGASFFGRVVPDILADKTGRLNGLCAAALSSGILALCWSKVTTNASIIVFTFFYGFTSSAIVSLMSAAVAQVPENPRDIGTYMGMGMFCVSFAALIGPPINGALITHYHGFTQVTIFSGLKILVGAFAILLVKHANGKGVFSKI